MGIYLFANGAMPTTAALVAVTTGTAIKTMLQVKASATNVIRILEWGISFDGTSANTPGKVELLETDVAATVTAAVANDIYKIDGDALSNGDVTTNLIQVGTTSTGYTSTAEGTITATRLFDVQFISPTNQYVKQFAPGNEPVIQISKFGRIRVTFGTAVNAYCYVVLRV